MQEPFYTGHWWVPGSEVKINGGLYFDDTNHCIILQTFTAVYLDGTAAEEKPRAKYPQTYYELVLGKAYETTTLYQCDWSGTRKVGKDIYQINYKVGFVIQGAWISSRQEMKCATGKFNIPYTGSWSNGWHQSQKLDLLLKSNNKDLLASEELPFVIDENLTIVFVNEIAHTSKTIIADRSYSYYNSVLFAYKEPVDFEKLLTDASRLRKLMELSVSKPLRLAILQVDFNSPAIQYNRDYPFEQERYPLHIANLSFLKGEKIETSSENALNMLLSADDLNKEELQTVLQKWFHNEAFHPLYEMYLDSNNWLQKSNTRISHIMYNNKFLNLIQALEGFYRLMLLPADDAAKSFNQNKQKVLRALQNDPALKQWLNNHLYFKKNSVSLQQKLASLLELMAPVTSTILDNSSLEKAFPIFAAKKRNLLSHGRQQDTDQGKAFRPMFFAAQLYCAILILESLEVNDVGGKLKKCLLFREHFHYLRNAQFVLQEQTDSMIDKN
jgi:hypothetical protein